MATAWAVMAVVGYAASNPTSSAMPKVARQLASAEMVALTQAKLAMMGTT